MRDYSKVGPKFWIGATGKRLRAAGMEAQIVAMYLMTCPAANMLGLFYCPLMFIAHETGLGLEGASKGLQRSIEAGFCHYDEGSEVVWVIEMAKYQVGEALKLSDLRVKGVQNEYASLPDNPYLMPFYTKYGGVFCMTTPRGHASPSEAPSKSLGSQEQEQEQEQKQEQEQEQTQAQQASDQGGAGDVASGGDETQESDNPPAGPTDQSGAGAGAAPPQASDDADQPTPPPETTVADTLSVADLVAEGVDKQHAKDWLKVRKSKNAPLTLTAWNDVVAEAKKAGLTPAQAVAKSAANSWQGFKAKWVGLKVEAAPSGAQGGNATRNYGTGGRL